MINSVAKKNNSIHAGHRVRLMELAYVNNVENLTPIQQVEVMLCYVFPRGDVNPLAHRLLDRYQNLPTILEAPVEDLKMVEGMGLRSAIKLHNILGLYHAYVYRKTGPQKKLTNCGEVYDYLEALLRFKAEEEIHVLGVDKEGNVIADRCLARGNQCRVGFKFDDIILFANTFKVQNILVAHNHPNGKCVKSDVDKNTHLRLSQLMKLSGYYLVDNIVVGDDGIYSIKDETMRRIFFENNKYDDALNELGKLSQIEIDKN